MAKIEEDDGQWMTDCLKYLENIPGPVALMWSRELKDPWNQEKVRLFHKAFSTVLEKQVLVLVPAQQQISGFYFSLFVVLVFLGMIFDISGEGLSHKEEYSDFTPEHVTGACIGHEQGLHESHGFDDFCSLGSPLLILPHEGTSGGHSPDMVKESLASDDPVSRGHRGSSVVASSAISGERESLFDSRVNLMTTDASQTWTGCPSASWSAEWFIWLQETVNETGVLGNVKSVGMTMVRVLKKEMEFHQAAKKNDVLAMTRLMEQQVNINARNNLNRTALHFAVAGNHMQAVGFLLSHKARVDTADKHGLTVLHLAAWSADLTIVQMLIKAGVSQKATNEEGMNVLHFAAQNNKIDIVNYLIKDLQLNDLNILDKKGRRAFHLAAEKGHIDMINNLVSLNLFSSEKDKEGNTALHLAAKNGHIEVVKALVEKWEGIDEPNEIGATPFYLAVEGGHDVCVTHLLTNGRNMNITTNDGYGALHVAAENGYISLVNYLIENNIDLSFKPNERNTPFHLAILNNHMLVVDALLDMGYINATNARQQTPLHLAAELRNIDLVEKLLKKGCDLTITDKQGKTALGAAARSNHTLIVDMIIKAERYYSWKKGLTENNNEGHEDICLTFKQDHLSKTSQIRSALWNLAYNQLKPNEWKKLAHQWKFTELQIKAIEEQWIGKASYKEHGHRMLLIWLHGVLLKEENPIKSLYEELVQAGHLQLAGNS
ncbi:ankyrin repeat and death domain-containing protein 1B [Rhinophrynus dorsalis]